jgi:folate-dependent phosphoribosylglycinamide formyltransferase PurN
MGADYVSHAHSPELARGLLSEMQCAVGIIAGARILPAEIIDRFSVGVLNIHPSLLPGARGLDSWLWDLEKGDTLGNTAHLIDSRIDCGRLVAKCAISPEPDESLPEIWFRLLSAQAALLEEALDVVGHKDPADLPPLEQTSPMPGVMPEAVLERLAAGR